MERLTEEELTDVTREFPTHFGEPLLSVLVQRMVTEIRARRAADLSAADAGDIARFLPVLQGWAAGDHEGQTALRVLRRLLARVKL